MISYYVAAKIKNKRKSKVKQKKKMAPQPADQGKLSCA